MMKSKIKSVITTIADNDPLAIIILIIFSILYLGSLYNYGYDWGDIGSYAQICYEVYLGSSPTDFSGYGVGWYLLGAGLFHIFGVNYIALIIMIYGLMAISACLMFWTLRIATGRFWVAFAAAALMIVIPPFAASTVRSLCLALFALPLILLARTPIESGCTALVAAAAALGTVAVLRPDISYLFLAILLLIVAVRSWFAGSRLGARTRQFAGSLALILLVMIILFAPLAWFAARHGFLTSMENNYIGYYFTFYNILISDLHNVTSHLTGHVSSVETVSHDGAITHQVSDRPMLPAFSTLWKGDWNGRIFAFLIYSTTIGMIFFGIYTIIQGFRQSVSPQTKIIALAITLIVGSQWPIFALFRPDWSHFITFMQAYLLLAAVTVAFLVPSRAGWSWGLKGPALVVIGIQIALFVVQGLQAPGMGWLAQRQGREDIFKGPAGVHVRVSTGERMVYQAITDIIQANSKPDDRIICYPYCPGFAFMSQRRMLFPQYYVDDEFGFHNLDWIDQAIIKTQEARVPVIIIQDWGPNGTESSRFDHWASRYMDFVHKSYPVALHLPGMTLWLLHKPTSPPFQAEIKAYGPSSIAVSGSNLQSKIAVWMSVTGLHATSAIQLDGEPLVSTVGTQVITAELPQSVAATPGRHWLQIIDPAFNLSSEKVPFDVTSP